MKNDNLGQSIKKALLNSYNSEIIERYNIGNNNFRVEGKNQQPSEYFENYFKELIEELKTKGKEDISKELQFTLKLYSPLINYEINNKYYYYINLDDIKIEKFKLNEYFKNGIKIELKIGSQNNEIPVILEGKSFIIYIEKKKSNFEFIVEQTINIQSNNKKKKLNLKSLIEGIDINSTTCTTEIKEIKGKKILRDFKFLILIYNLEKVIIKPQLSEIPKNITTIGINNNIYYIKPKGLSNKDGSYCYMNSVLQCLFALTDFREKFIKEKYDRSSQPISFGLQNVIKGLMYNNINNDSYDPSEFKKILSRNAKLFKNFAGDPSDLILYLLDQIHEENKYEVEYSERKINEEKENEVYQECLDNIDKSIISDLFYGYYGEVSKCSTCRKKFYLIEPKFLIELNVEEYNKNEKKKFSPNKYFQKNNYEKISKKYFICPKCLNKKLADVNSYIKKLPEILVIVLKNSKKDRIEIEKSEINFENQTTFKLIGTSTIAYRPDNRYFGHAIAFCLHNNQYYSFNDSKVDYANFSDFNNQDHYILFYTKKN